MLRKPNFDTKPIILNSNQIWKRFSKEFNILLDIGYYEGTKFAQFFNVTDDAGRSNIYETDPHEEEIKAFDKSPTNAMKYLVGLVGMGKTTLIRNYYRITDREVKIRPANFESGRHGILNQINQVDRVDLVNRMDHVDNVDRANRANRMSNPDKQAMDTGDSNWQDDLPRDECDERDERDERDEYLIYISFYYAELRADKPHEALTAEVERYMSEFLEKLFRRCYKKLVRNNEFWEGLYNFIDDNKPTLLSTSIFTPSGIDLNSIDEKGPSLEEKKNRLDKLYKSSPLEYYSSTIKYVLKQLDRPYKITFIFDDIEAKSSIFHKDAIEIARHIFSCFNANTDKNCIVKTLVSLRAYTFRVNMERIAEARREIIEKYVILKKGTVSLHDIFDKRFQAISSSKTRNIRNSKSYSEAKRVLDYVEARLELNGSGLIFALQDYNLCSSMVLYSKILTNLVWISYNEKEIKGAFKLNDQNYRLTTFNLIRAISMGNTTLYDGTSDCVPNIIQNNGVGSDLLCLYIIRYLKNHKIDEVYGEQYIEGQELLSKVQNLFCSSNTPKPIREKWREKINEAINFLFQKGILFRSLYDIEIEDPDQIQRVYQDTFKLYLAPRGNKLYSLLKDNSVLLEIYRDDIEVDLPNNNVITYYLPPFEKFEYIIRLLEELFTVEKRNIAQALWNLDTYLEDIGDEFIVQHLLCGVVNNIQAYYGEIDESHNKLVEIISVFIDSMIDYGTKINRQYKARFKLSGLSDLRTKISRSLIDDNSNANANANDITETSALQQNGREERGKGKGKGGVQKGRANLSQEDEINSETNNTPFTEDDIYSIASAEYSVQHQEMGYPSSWWDLLEGTKAEREFDQLSVSRQEELEQRMHVFVHECINRDFQELEELDEDDFENGSAFIEKRQAIINNISLKLKEEFHDFIMEEISMYSVHYIESMSIPVQGTYEEVHKKYKGYIIREHGGGRGNWLAIKSSDVRVNGESYREFVLEHYGKDTLTKGLAKQFEYDLNTGKVTLP